MSGQQRNDGIIGFRDTRFASQSHRDIDSALVGLNNALGQSYVAKIVGHPID